MAQIFRHLLESTVFALGIAVLAFLLRSRSASSRYAVWFTAVTKFAIPIAALVQLGVASQSLLAPHHSSFLSTAGFPQVAYPLLNVPAPSPGDSHNLVLILSITAWLSGSLSTFGLWIRRAFAGGTKLQAASTAEHDVLARLRQEFGIQRAVGLRYCAPDSQELGLQGFLHPTIRIPERLSAQLAPEEFEAVLLHELAHVRHCNNFLGALVHCVVCVFWFHPLLWWIERRLLVERERACDELVLRHGSSPEFYVQGILKVCRLQLNDAIAGTSGMTRSDLKRRMELIMSYQSRNPPSRAQRLLLATLASFVTVVPLAIGFLQQSGLSAQPVADSQHLWQPPEKRGCVADSIPYPSGTALQMGTQTRECLGGRWISTRKAATVVMREQLSAVCQVKPSTSKDSCSCQDGNYSLGTITQAADHSFIRCDKFQLGQFTEWRPATPGELRGR